MKELERPLKALANRRRLAILKYLRQNREASVGEIAGAIKLSFRATSRHLGVLTAADILDREQRSLAVYYRFASPLPAAVRAVIHLV